MEVPPTPASYRILDAAGVRDLLAGLPAIAGKLGATPSQWDVREVGDGNLNLVFIVEGPTDSVCVKQAVPYVRVAGPSWPLSLERAFYEVSYFRMVSPYVDGRIPEILHYDAALYCTVMERLSPHIILRHGLIAGYRYPNMGRQLGEYVAGACFFTSDLAQPFEHKFDGMALFAGNQALLRITVDLIFADPYRESARNRHTSPQLDAIATQLRLDGPLKSAVSRLGLKFLSDTQALIHGDLHSGSVMVTEHDTRVIDPEFAFYGPIGFDLGAFFGNLLLSWYSQPGHAADSDDRTAYREWILEQAATFWTVFRERFLAHWREHARGDAFPASLFAPPEAAATLCSAQEEFMDSLFADMLGFAACKMIRRIVGFAHVIDFESIANVTIRARCETDALSMARRLLTEPERFRCLQHVLDAVRDQRVNDPIPRRP